MGGGLYSRPFQLCAEYKHLVSMKNRRILTVVKDGKTVKIAPLTLKNTLKERRIKAGLSQTQLAEIIGVSANSISSIEICKFCPTAYNAALLCAALDCKFEDMFYLEADSAAATDDGQEKIT